LINSDAYTALNEDGTYRNSVWYRTIGEAYIPIAFRFAQQADPNVKLYYNDYNTEYGQAKTQGAIRIVKLVQSYGVKIDGVGLQGHMVVAKTNTQSTPVPSLSTLTSVLQSFADLNVDVAWTELDIRMPMPATQSLLNTQAEQYARVATACMNVARCVGITIWVRICLSQFIVLVVFSIFIRFWF
jgi:endo-1,4-beta-xylanase